MLDVNRTFTPSEAAVASGVPLKIVNQEIDQGPLKAARKESGSKRSLKEDDLFYLVIANRLDTHSSSSRQKAKTASTQRSLPTGVDQGLSFL